MNHISHVHLESKPAAYPPLEGVAAGRGRKAAELEGLRTSLTPSKKPVTINTL